MNRRSFIRTALGAAAAFTLDPESLLWKPNKAIFIPKVTYAEQFALVSMHQAGGLSNTVHRRGFCEYMNFPNWIHAGLRNGIYRQATVEELIRTEELSTCTIQNITQSTTESDISFWDSLMGGES